MNIRDHSRVFRFIGHACVALIVAGVIGQPGCRLLQGNEEESADKAPEERVVRLFIWSDYISPDVVSRFEKETGIRLEITTFDTQEEEIGRVWSGYGHYDVVVAEESIVDLFSELGLLQPFRTRELPNLVNVNPRFLREPAESEEHLAIPYHWGTTVLAYRQDRVGVLPETWNVLWDPRKRGRVWLLNDLEELIALARLRMGLRRDSPGKTVWTRLREEILELNGNVACYTDTLAIADALVTGDCDIGVLYNGDAARAAQKNTNVVYVIPEEGTPLWIDNLCLLRDGEHVEAAHRLVNFLLDGSVAAQNANYVRFATPNASAVSELDESLLKDHRLYLPDALLERCVFYEQPDAKMLQFQSSLRAELNGRVPGAVEKNWAEDGVAVPESAAGGQP